MKIFKLTVYHSIFIVFITLYFAINAVAGWSEISTGKNINTAQGVWGSLGNHLFVAGQSDSILHFDGNEWNKMDTNSNVGSFGGVWGSSSGDVYVVGLDGTIAHYSGNAWNTIPINENQYLKDVWGSSNDNVFVVGNGGVIYHYDGNEWLKMTTNVTGDIYGVWGSSGSDVYASGDGFIIHYDGSAWEKVFETTTRLYAIFGISKSNIYAVSQTALIYHYDGDQWSEIWSEYSQANTYLNGIWGTKGGVWFVGQKGVNDSLSAYFLYFDANNGTLNEIILSTFGALKDIWGASSGEVYAVGGDSSTLVLNFNGVFDDDYTQLYKEGETDSVGEQAIDDSDEDPNRAPDNCFISTLNYK